MSEGVESLLVKMDIMRAGGLLELLRRFKGKISKLGSAGHLDTNHQGRGEVATLRHLLLTSSWGKANPAELVS